MDRTAKLWHLEYRYPVRIFAGHEKDVDVVRFHPNCNYFATGSIDKSVRLWSYADAKMVRRKKNYGKSARANYGSAFQVRIFSGQRGGIYSLSFSPDGKLLATGGEDRRIRVWDLASSNILKELKGHSDTVYSLAWSKDSALLASGGLDGTVRLWDVKGPPRQEASTSTTPSSSSHSAEMVASFPTNCSNVHDLRYSHHNTLMASGSSGFVVGATHGHAAPAAGTAHIKKDPVLNGEAAPSSYPR